MAKQETITPFQQLKIDLKEKNPGNFYVFHGEETFLMQHYLTQMKKLLLDEVTEAFNFHRLTAESFDIRTLADAVENLPMMAEHSMVHLDDIDPFKLPEADRTKLAEILQDIPSYCTVIFTFVTAGWKPDKRLKKLWDSFEKAQIVEFAKQEQRDLVPWIGRHFMAKGKRISNDLCVYLMEITGGTMTALAGEIAKICAYSGAEQIVKSDIDAVVEPVMDAVVFQMTDMIGAGKYGDALKKLQQLIKMQQEPVAILGALGGHFRKLSAARVLADNGKQAADLMKLFRMSDYAARKTMDTARRFSLQFYAKANELILETDYKLKTSFDDSDRLLEMLIMEIAMESRS
jgi:DNA polymerase-3 subunit delta